MADSIFFNLWFRVSKTHLNLSFKAMADPSGCFACLVLPGQVLISLWLVHRLLCGNFREGQDESLLKTEVLLKLKSVYGACQGDKPSG